MVEISPSSQAKAQRYSKARLTQMWPFLLTMARMQRCSRHRLQTIVSSKEGLTGPIEFALLSRVATETNTTTIDILEISLLKAWPWAHKITLRRTSNMMLWIKSPLSISMMIVLCDQVRLELEVWKSSNNKWWTRDSQPSTHTNTNRHNRNTQLHKWCKAALFRKERDESQSSSLLIRRRRRSTRRT